MKTNVELNSPKEEGIYESNQKQKDKDNIHKNEDNANINNIKNISINENEEKNKEDKNKNIINEKNNNDVIIKNINDYIENNHKKYVLPIMLEISHIFFSHIKTRYGNLYNSPILHSISGKNNFLCV